MAGESLIAEVKNESPGQATTITVGHSVPAQAGHGGKVNLVQGDVRQRDTSNPI